MTTDGQSAGSARFATLIARLFRWPVVLLTLAVLAALLWTALYPWVTQRRLSLDLTVENAGLKWSLEWVRQSDGARNGAWLELPCIESEWLEIRTSGVSRSADGAFEVWFYHAIPLDPRHPPLDLKAIIATAGPEDKQGSWVPNVGDAGVVYYGPGPGLLRMRAPEGGIQLHLARLPISGEVTVTYADDTQTIDLAASSFDVLISSLSRKVFIARSDLRVEQALPNYDLGRIELRWQDSGRATVTMHSTLLSERVFGFETGRRLLTPRVETGAIAHHTDVGRAHFEMTQPEGAILLNRSAQLSLIGQVAGYGLTLATLAAIACLCWLGPHVPRMLLTRVPRFETVAFALVVGARFWLALWAPYLYSYDSMDYLGNSLRLLGSGSFDHFDQFRMPGYSCLILPLLSLHDNPSLALSLLNGVFGVTGAALVYLTLKRLTSPPWPAIGLLLVGLDPIMLTYERYALTECPSAFLVTLIGWMVALHVSRDPTSTGSRRAGLFSAAVIGVLCALAAGVRSNLQSLIVLVPLALLISALGRRRGWLSFATPVLVVLCAVLTLLPWLIHNQHMFGRPVVATGVHAKLLESLWLQHRSDLNQTAVYTHERWAQRRKEGLEDHWRLMNDIREARGWASPADALSAEEMYRRALDEDFARKPLEIVRMRWEMLGLQSGFLLHGHSGENFRCAEALRGRPPETTNFLPYAKESAGYRVVQAAFPRLEEDITYLYDSGSAAWFDRIYPAFDLIRPLVAALFAVGALLSLRNRCYTVMALGLIVLGNLVALAYLMTPIDRYGVPFKPLIAVVAVYALYRIVQGRRAATSAHAADC